MIRVNPPELLRCYLVECRALVLAMIVNNAIALMVLGLFSQSPYRWLMVFPAIWAGLWIVLPIRRLSRMAREEELARQYRTEGFSVSDTGISCNIALTSGPVRAMMRNQQMGVLNLPWNKIRRVIVHPERIIRSHEPQHKNMQHIIPGSYELELTEDAASTAGLKKPLPRINIMRALLAAHEMDILNFIETSTQVPVERKES